jgi:hypothetical protein
MDLVEILAACGKKIIGSIYHHALNKGHHKSSKLYRAFYFVLHFKIPRTFPFQSLTEPGRRVESVFHQKNDRALKWKSKKKKINLKYLQNICRVELRATSWWYVLKQKEYLTKKL